MTIAVQYTCNQFAASGDVRKRPMGEKKEQEINMKDSLDPAVSYDLSSTRFHQSRS